MKESCSRVSPRAALEYVVEIGANRQSCDPSALLMLKLMLEVVLGISSGVTERRSRDVPSLLSQTIQNREP